jgi:ribonuclease P protein component
LIVGAGQDAPAGLGLIVGRKVLPKAVARNRARRLLREAYRRAPPALAGSTVLLRLRRAPRDPAMRDIFSEALALLARAAAR